MKTRQFFVVAFLFCFAITTRAQQPIVVSANPNPSTNYNYQDDLDFRLSALDKSQIPTGCLYSRVYPLSCLLSTKTASRTCPRLGIFSKRTQNSTTAFIIKETGQCQAIFRTY
jgi:hypothetical protein